MAEEEKGLRNKIDKLERSLSHWKEATAVSWIITIGVIVIVILIAVGSAN